MTPRHEWVIYAAGIAFAAIIGCTSVQKTQPGLPPPERDSMLAECPWEVKYARAIAADMPLAQQKQAVEARLSAVKLRAVWQHEYGAAFDDTPADRARLGHLADIVLPALERYPPRAFETFGLWNVVLVKDLVVAKQRRRAMPDPANNAVVYAENGDQLCPAGMELRVHHEFHHFIDYRLHGDYYYRDPEWIALNRGQIEYGRGGAAAYGINFDNLGHPAAGLVSRYAAYGVEEDKAEVFGWMMTPGYARRLDAWASADAVLAVKKQHIARRIDGATGGTFLRNRS